MTAKHYLSRAFWIDRRIEKKQDEIDRIRARLTRATSQLTDMPKGGSGGDWTDADIRVLEMEKRIHEEILELCRIKREIAETIDSVEDARYRTVLEMRYRNYMRFEEIAVLMHYSYDYIRELHGNALRAVAEKIPTQSHTDL